MRGGWDVVGIGLGYVELRQPLQCSSALGPLFVFTAVIEVKLHISVRFLHFISFRRAPDDVCVCVRVCVYECVCTSVFA